MTNENKHKKKWPTIDISCQHDSEILSLEELTKIECKTIADIHTYSCKTDLRHKPLFIDEIIHNTILSMNAENNRYKLKTDFVEFYKHYLTFNNPELKFKYDSHIEAIVTYVNYLSHQDSTPDILADKRHPFYQLMIDILAQLTNFIRENFIPIILNENNFEAKNIYYEHAYHELTRNTSDGEYYNEDRSSDQANDNKEKSLAYIIFGTDTFYKIIPIEQTKLTSPKANKHIVAHRENLAMNGHTGLVFKDAPEGEKIEVSMKNFIKMFQEKCKLYEIPLDVRKKFNEMRKFQVNWFDKLDGNMKKRLAISMPPRVGKSEIVSVIWPAWILGQNPRKKIISVTGSRDLTRSFGDNTRILMGQRWYRMLFPSTILEKKSNSKEFYKTTYGGERKSTFTNARILGFGADYIILDDPQDIMRSKKMAYCESIFEWFHSTLDTRMNMPGARERMVLCMHRINAKKDLIEFAVEDNAHAWDHIVEPLVRSEALANNLSSMRRHWPNLALSEEKKDSTPMLSSNANGIGSELLDSEEEKEITTMPSSIRRQKSDLAHSEEEREAINILSSTAKRMGSELLDSEKKRETAIMPSSTGNGIGSDLAHSEEKRETITIPSSLANGIGSELLDSEENTNALHQANIHQTNNLSNTLLQTGGEARTPHPITEDSTIKNIIWQNGKIVNDEAQNFEKISASNKTKDVDDIDKNKEPVNENINKLTESSKKRQDVKLFETVDAAVAYLRTAAKFMVDVETLEDELLIRKVGDKIIFREDDILDAEKFTPDVISDIKKRTDPEHYDATYLQLINKKKHSIIDPESIQYFDYNTVIARVHSGLMPVVISWDTASTEGSGSYSVGTVWGVWANQYYLIDMFRAQVGYVKLKEAVIDLFNEYLAHVTAARRFKAIHVLIENKSSGRQLIQELSDGQFNGLIPSAMEPKGQSKEMRLMSIKYMFDNGRVYLPKLCAEFAESYGEFAVNSQVALDEICGFPNCKYNDIVDSVSWALWNAHQTNYTYYGAEVGIYDKVKVEIVGSFTSATGVNYPVLKDGLIDGYNHALELHLVDGGDLCVEYLLSRNRHAVNNNPKEMFYTRWYLQQDGITPVPEYWIRHDKSGQFVKYVAPDGSKWIVGNDGYVIGFKYNSEYSSKYDLPSMDIDNDIVILDKIVDCDCNNDCDSTCDGNCGADGKANALWQIRIMNFRKYWANSNGWRKVG